MGVAIVHQHRLGVRVRQLEHGAQGTLLHLQRHLVVSGAPEEIQPHLPHRHRTRVAQQRVELAQLRAVRCGRFVRMPADAEEDPGVRLRQHAVAIGVLEVETDADDAVHARRDGALQRGLQQPFRLQEHEVTVGVHQRRRPDLAHRRGCAPTSTVHSPRGGVAPKLAASSAAVPM